VSKVLVVRNRQRARSLNTKFLRNVLRALLTDELPRDDFEIGVSIIGEEAMTRMNEGYLRHKGSTDVITFDYTDASRPKCLAGEIFVCLDEALAQAPKFRVSWQHELVRYAVHGILHLAGFDDKLSRKGKEMKREENRLMSRLSGRFKLEQIATHRGTVTK
jgi:rRNA maturation RNase YbeY